MQWIEYFEAECSGLVVDHGGRVIKNIGDEVLFVADDVAAAAEAALTMTARGQDPDDEFPEVRAGLAYGDVVSRLGDVFGPTVNIASRLTSVARPGAVLIDQGAHDALTGDTSDEEHEEREHAGFSFRRMRRTSVKGYARLQSWVLRRARQLDRGRRTAHRIVTWRLARPERAERWSPVQGGVVGQRRVEVARERATPGPRGPPARCRAAGPRPAHSSPCARNMPDQPGPRHDDVLAGDVQARERVEELVLGLGHAPSAGAPWCRRRSSTPPRPGSAARSGVAAALACSSAAAQVVLVVDVGEPEVEAVVDGDLQRARR